MTIRGAKQRTITTALLAAVMVLVAVLGAGGTYALYQQRYEVPPIKIASGSAELEVSLIDTSAVGDLFPGETIAAPVLVSNVGTADLQVSATTAGIDDIDISLIDAPTCSSDSISQTMVPISSGESRTMCLKIELTTDSPRALQGAASAVEIDFEGVAGSWNSQNQVPVNISRGKLSFDLNTWDAGLLGLTAGGVEVKNTSARPIELSMEVVGGGLLNLNNTYLASNDECNGLLAPVLELLLGSGVYELGEVPVGGTVYVCMSSLLGLGSGQVTVTATYPDSLWETTRTSNSFRF